MEIEFSPSQLPPARATSPVKSTATSSASIQPEPLQGMAELLRKLNDLALTRPDKMAAASEALADLKYPPDQLLKSIAHLLAVELDQ
jgi:hypothetical protein